MTAAEAGRELGIVIITMDRAEELDRTLVELGHLARGIPTVVVDNASTDDTQKILARHPWARTVRLTSNLGGAGRNVGAREFGTDLVAFVDDDTWPEPGAFERAAVFLHAHPEVAVVAARILVGASNRLDPVCQAKADGSLGRIDGAARVVGFLAGASIVRTRALLDVGGFHPAFGVGGEEELATWDLLDRGWELVYLPTVVVHHHPSTAHDPRARAIREIRNRIWSAWLRWPLRAAAQRSWQELHHVRQLGMVLEVCGTALRGMPMVVRERRRLRRSTLAQLGVTGRDRGRP